MEASQKQKREEAGLVESETTSITSLLSELLFTLENMEKQARLLGKSGRTYGYRPEVLEQMEDNAGRLNHLLLGLKEVI